MAAILCLNGAKNNPKIITKITAVRPKGCIVARGVRRISFREGLAEHMASAVARAYNGGLGAEPPAGSRGGGQGGEAP